MDKAEQPTTQVSYTVADYELAEQCVSAANVVTCDGYYEVDIEKVAETLAKARTTSLAAQEGLVERDAIANKLRAFVDEAIEDELGDASLGYAVRGLLPDIDAAANALSAIKEQHHD